MYQQLVIWGEPSSWPQVHSEWQGWLNQAFQATQTHNALLYLLLNGIKDQRFVDESIIYGKDLIKHAVVQDEVI